MSSDRNRLTFERLTAEDKRETLKLTGELDESAPSVLFQVKNIIRLASEAVIDTSEVSHVNSAGMSHYAKFAQEVKDCRIRYVKCASAFIDFANMLPGILKNAKVESFCGTYFCQPCDNEFYLLIDNVEAAMQKEAACPDCGSLVPSVGFLEELQTSGTLPAFLDFSGQSG